MIGRKKISISKNLTMGLVLVIVILSTVFIGINYYQVSRNASRQLERMADKYIHSIAGTLEIPLWDMDRENINTVCNYYIQNDWVVRVKLTGISGEVMFEKSIEDEGIIIKRSLLIVHNGETIGRVEIDVSSLESHKAKLESLKVLITGLFICVAGLVIFTGVLLEKLIREPMAVLGEIAESYAKGDYRPNIDFIPYKEFDTVVSVLFKMGETIESQMNELRSAEDSLKKHRDSLEETIAERTRELKRSNQQLQNEVHHRKQAQKAFREKDRLQGVLELSGAISHEMNQPLMSALGYFDLMLLDMGEDDPYAEQIGKIKIQLERMSGITKKLMEISRYQTKAYLDGHILDLSKSANDLIKK